MWSWHSRLFFINHTLAGISTSYICVPNNTLSNILQTMISLYVYNTACD